MLTFSINSRTFEDKKAKKVAQLVKEITDYNREHIGEAYISIVEGENDQETFSLSTYIKAKDKNSATKNSEEVSLSQDDNDYLDDIRLSYTEENETVNDADFNYYLNYFLDLREKWFLKKGIDLWRLVVLTDTYKDKSAAEKLYFLLKENDEMDLFSEIFSNRKFINKLHKILD